MIDAATSSSTCPFTFSASFIASLPSRIGRRLPSAPMKRMRFRPFGSSMMLATISPSFALGGLVPSHQLQPQQFAQLVYCVQRQSLFALHEFAHGGLIKIDCLADAVAGHTACIDGFPE